MAKENYIVILAGGGGTRLWPKSRAKTPKQFLKILNDKTLFQETINRISGSYPFSNIFVVANKRFASEIKKEAPSIPAENILAEPSPKNTAAAIGFAAAKIARKNPDAIMSTIAADHYVKGKEKFIKVLSVSQKAAASGDYLIIMGITPSHPHTGLGYIHKGNKKLAFEGVPLFEVKGFKEKPNEATALRYFESGEYFWNANINTYRVSSILDSITLYFPELSKVLDKVRAGKSEKEIKSGWEQLSPEPIDTAILEKAKNVLVVKAEFSWFDVGDWSSIHSILSDEPEVNILVGEEPYTHLEVDTKGCLIHGTSKLIATVGLRDLVIVDTPDILMICPKNRAQDVKKLVEKLAEEKKHDYL
jgi:mannose-1-phosphate guanylyltransferase